MKRKIFALVMCGIILLSESSVFANNCKNRDLPNKKVGFEFSKAAETGLRRKEDTTSHYIKNESGFDLWVISKPADDKNKTVNGYAIIPSNTQRRIRNRIKEDGYNWCKLNITSAKSGVSGNLKGVWSPDSIGKYTPAN